MPSTHLSLHYHVVFSTKNRARLIRRDWCDRLYAYIGGIAKNLGVIPVSIGGIDDHIHLLLGLKATHCLSNIMKDLKQSSTLWVHQDIGESLFYWQEGYGAFTVSASQIQIVKNYIEQQEQHHKGQSFQDEYLKLLMASGVQYNEKYLW